MALPDKTIHISDFVTTDEVTPEDYIPIIRPDVEDRLFDNYKTKARNFVSYPYGYLWGGNFVYSNGVCTVGHTHCRDSQGKANISIEDPITKTVDANLFYPASVPQESGKYYVLVARKSETDSTASFFISSSSGGALGVDWAYSRAVAECYFDVDTMSFSGVRCYASEIIIVQEGEITAGSELESGKIALVIEPL